MVVRAKRTDGKQQGYQIAAYADFKGPKPRVQLYAEEISKSGRWKVCADAAVLSNYKAAATMKWGQNCKDYAVTVKAKTGQFASHPAVQLKVEWERLPQAMKETARMVSDYVPGVALMSGFSYKMQNNPSRELSAVLAAMSPRTLDLAIRIPKETFYYRGLQLPSALPVTMDTTGAQLPEAVLRTLQEFSELITTEDAS